MRKWLATMLAVLLMMPLLPAQAAETNYSWIGTFCKAPQGQTGKTYKQAPGSKVWTNYTIDGSGNVKAPYIEPYGQGIFVRPSVTNGILTGTMQQYVMSNTDPYVPTAMQLVFVDPNTGVEVGRSEAMHTINYKGTGDPDSTDPLLKEAVPGREVRLIDPAVDVIAEMNKLGLTNKRYLLYVQPLDSRMHKEQQCLNFAQTPVPVYNKVTIENQFDEMYVNEKRTVVVQPYDTFNHNLSNTTIATATKSGQQIEVAGKQVGTTTLNVTRDNEKDAMMFKVNPYIATAQTTVKVDTAFQVTVAGLPSDAGNQYDIYGSTKSGLPSSVSISNKTATSFTLTASEEEIITFFIRYEKKTTGGTETYNSNALTVNISGGRPATSVVIKKQYHDIYVGEKKALRSSVTTVPENALFTWKSTEPDYVTVDSKGFITGVRDSGGRAIDVIAISGNHTVVFKVVVKTLQAKVPAKPIIGVQVANDGKLVDSYRTNDNDPVLQTAQAATNELDVDYATKAEIRITGVNLKDSHYKILKTNNINDGTWLPLNIGSGKVVQSTKPADMTDLIGLNAVYYNVLHMPSISNVSLWENRAETFKFLASEAPIRKYGYKATVETNPDNFYGDHLFYPTTNYDSSSAKVWPKAVDLKEASKYWGYFVAPETGYYNLGISSDDGNFGYVLKDGQPVIFSDQFKVQGSTFSSANKPVYMTKGYAYPIYLEYFNWGGQADFRLLYRFHATSQAATLYSDSGAGVEGTEYVQSPLSTTNLATMKIANTELRTSTNSDPLVFAEARFDVPFEVELPKEEGSYYIAVKATSSAPSERQLIYGPFNIVNKTLPKVAVNYKNGNFVSPVKTSVTKGVPQQVLSADDGVVALNNKPSIQVNVTGDGKAKPTNMTYELFDDKNASVAKGAIGSDGKVDIPLTLTGKVTLKVEATLYKNRVTVMYGPIDVIKLTISSDKTSIYVGEQATLQANLISTGTHTIVWTPGDLLTGASNLQATLIGSVPGTVTVTAKTNDTANAEATQSIVVKKAIPSSLSFGSQTVTIKVGETASLADKLQIVPADVAPYVKLDWKDSTPNTYIALNSSGIIRGLQPGYTHVTVTAVEEPTIQGKITVIVKDNGTGDPDPGTNPGVDENKPKSNFKW